MVVINYLIVLLFVKLTEIFFYFLQL